MQGKIDESIPRAEVEVYEVGIYVNFYKNWSDWGTIEMGAKYYDSPSSARKGIMWDQTNLEYLFTAKITDTVFKYEK